MQTARTIFEIDVNSRTQLEEVSRLFPRVTAPVDQSNPTYGDNG